MYITNDISISKNCQQEHKTNWRTPKVHKRKRYRQPRRFDLWYGTALSPLVNGLPDLKKLLSGLSKTKQKILELFIYMRSQGLTNWMSEETIARHVGVSRGHVSRCLRDLRDWGLVDIYYRGSPGSNLSNVYKVADIFMKSHIWPELMSILPIFRSFFLFFCLVKPILNPYPHEFGWASPGWRPKNVTRLINKENKDIKILSDTSVIETQNWLHNLIKRADYKSDEDDFRKKRHEKASDMYKPNNSGFLKDFRNTKKGYDNGAAERRISYMKQEADRVSYEAAERSALLEAEQDTEKSKENWAKGNEILRRAGLL